MNVLLIQADDLRADLLAYMPFVNGVLRREGTRFTNMRCDVPLCQPARAALVTGQYAWRPANGVYANSGAASALPSPATHALPVWLAALPAGPTTGVFGKYLTVTPAGTPQPGWDDWRVVAPKTQEAYGYTVHAGTATSQPTEHQLTYIAREASTFITSTPGPWFCWYAPTNPHVNSTEFTNNPLPASLERFSWLRWAFDLLEDTTGKPSWIANLPQYTDAQLARLRTAIRQQVREAHDLDEVIAGLYADLVATGQLEDTCIVVTSDSGVFYGEQRLGNDAFSTTATKNHPYDVVAKVPCIARGPGFPAGTDADTVTVLQDVTATIVAIFGAQPTVPQDGVDLRTLVASPDPDRAVLYQRRGLTPSFPDGDGVVTRTRKLLRWIGASGADRYEAYDLDTDPGEHTSWANDPARLPERQQLEARLDALLA